MEVYKDSNHYYQKKLWNYSLTNCWIQSMAHSCAGNHQGQQPNNNSNCYYYGKPGHMTNNCYQKEHDAWNGKLQQGNYASTSIQGD